MPFKPSVIDVLDRAYNGPKCSLKEWDRKIIPEKAAEKTKELKVKFTPEILVPSDNSLFDEVFQAGFELAVETGLLCINTERMIKFDESELKAAINEGWEKIYLGEGPDLVEIVQRKPEDKRRPVLCMGPFGVATAEDIWIPMHEAAARCRYTDVLIGGVLRTVYGMEMRSGSPYEVMAGFLEAIYNKEAVRRAGRPGMAIGSVVSDMTGIAQLAAFSSGYYTRNDQPFYNFISELKTSYHQLNKFVQAMAIGTIRSAGVYAHPMIGGYVGGTEEATIMAVAAVILLKAAYQSELAEGTVTDIKTMGNSTREALWANSVACQAVHRNTKIKYLCDNSGSLDVCTEPFLYEVANLSMILTVSGVAESMGPRSGGGRYPDHATPLEVHLMGEVAEQSAGMKREDTNELALEILPKYEEVLRYPPKGKSFRECMDLRTLKPSKEWVDLYHSVRKNLTDIGLLSE